jgi:hypothetical protein
MSTATQLSLIIGLALVWALGVSRFDPRTGLAEAACTASNFDPSALRGDAAESDWLVYRNTRNGLSFRYPPSMQAVDVDAVKLGMVRDTNKVPNVVDLRGTGMIVRFICAPDEKTPQMAADMARRLHERAKYKSALTSMRIDGHEAVAASVRGGGAGTCLWGVTVLQPRACGIFPMGNSDDNSPPLHDGTLRLLSIIQTMHFTEAPNS